MKKKLALLLSLLVMISVFAACDSEKEDDNNTSLSDKYGSEAGKDKTDIEKRCEHEIDEDDWVTESYATCLEEGLRKATCSLCGEEVEETIEKTTHEPDLGEVRLDGYMHICCVFCGVEMEQKEAPRDYKSEFSADETGYYSTHVNHEYNVIKNKKNAVVYKFENGEELFAYGNGYFISKKDGVMYLKTAEGKEITNTVSLGVNGFGGLNGFGREEMKKLLADGYILAYKLDETSSDETYQIGVLKVDGTWLVPLAADNPLLTCGNFVSEDYIKEKIKYAGEGILFVHLFSASTDGECILYDINNKKTITYDTNFIGEVNLSNILEDFDFSNGVIRTFLDGNMREIKSDGTSTNTYIFPEGVSKYIDDANQYYISSDGTIYFIAKNANGLVLANSKGAIVKDFKAAYDADVTRAYHYGDGRWMLYLKDKDDTTYYTTIDITGEFKFTPIKYDAKDFENVIIVADKIDFISCDGALFVDFETGAEIYKDLSWGDYEYKNGVLCFSFAYLDDEFSVFEE